VDEGGKGSGLGVLCTEWRERVYGIYQESDGKVGWEGCWNKIAG